MKKIKIEFSKLIGSNYTIELKMFVLDWMLNSGKGHDYSYNIWYRDGINKALFGYSANNYNAEYSLPSVQNLNWYFDAIFARAVYAPENNSLKSWREKELILPNKYRILKYNDDCPHRDNLSIQNLISKIQNFKEKLIYKKYHQPDYPERKRPKIIDINIYTIGNGWIVEYKYSFIGYYYESGWVKQLCQKGTESIHQFLQRSYDELCSIVIKNQKK